MSVLMGGSNKVNELWWFYKDYIDKSKARIQLINNIGIQI